MLLTERFRGIVDGYWNANSTSNQFNTNGIHNIVGLVCENVKCGYQPQFLTLLIGVVSLRVEMWHNVCVSHVCVSFSDV